jgi:hypothetical protein
MAQLPDLSALSLGLETGVLLHWGTDGVETRLLASFHDAVLSHLVDPPGAVGNDKNEDGTDEDDEDEDEENLPLTVMSERRRDREGNAPVSDRTRQKRAQRLRDASAPEVNTQSLKEEYESVCWWLRLCMVPSQPGFLPGVVRRLDPENEPNANAINSAVNEIAGSESMAAKRRIDDDALENSIRSANNLLRRKLQMPAFRSLNADRKGLEDAYMRWLRRDANSAYTDEDLPVGEDAEKGAYTTTVEHVVAKDWLYPTQVLKEFVSAIHDPANVVWTQRVYNQRKGVKAVHFGDSGSFEYNLNASYAPLGFVPSLQPQIARIVAYMFLTYPLVTSNKHAGLRRNGAPKYAEQFHTIRRLCTYGVDTAELMKAWVSFAVFRTVNPLVVCPQVRNLLSDPSSWLSKLLFTRMYGNDACSDAVLSELLSSGVVFRDV